VFHRLGCVFRRKPATDSDASRPPIPIEAGHPVEGGRGALAVGDRIVTSQLPVEHWHEIIGDPTIADAILDRLVHNAYRLTLKGESLRKAAAKRHNLDADTAT
jgi:hypothetical protein